MKPSSSRLRGFTLIEVMVVVVILGLLAGIIVPKIMGRTDDARITTVRTDLKGVQAALDLYRLDNSVYPTTEQGLAALVQRPTSGPVPNNWKPEGYLSRMPRDPWGRDYQFLNPGTRGRLDLFSLGADGVPGGEGPNADIYLE